MQLNLIVLSAILICVHMIFLKSLNKRFICYCLNYYILIGIGVLSFILLIAHRYLHKCNILEKHTKSENSNIYLFIILFMFLGLINNFMRYRFIKNE